LTTERELLIAELCRDGPRRFARWDRALFETVVGRTTPILCETLAGQSDLDVVLEGYLRLLQEAVGAGFLHTATPGASWTNFLERCLVERLPLLLPTVPAGRRLPLLARVWNLGEGLRREPRWLDRYVTACAHRLTDLTDLDGFLVRTMTPVLSPAPPVTWRGPFAVTVLDLRSLHDDFLPGEIVLAAPAVLRVADRRQTLEAGVLLQHGRQSELLGLTEGLVEYAETAPGPPVEFHDGIATLGGQSVELPFLRVCHRHMVVSAGFVAACAVDSQRLWIVESP
jgi:hypothetical protein